MRMHILLRLECIMVTLHSMLVRIQLYEVSYQDIEMTVFVLMRDGICIYHVGIIL